VRSHADGDDTRFYAIAMQVAAQAALSGHGKFAQDLRALVDLAACRTFRLPWLVYDIIIPLRATESSHVPLHRR
jgi:hypothetical protein